MGYDRDMADSTTKSALTRRQVLGRMGTMAAASVVASPLVELALGEGGTATAQALPVAPLGAVAGHDRFVMLHGKTYLNAWVGYGAPPRPGGSGRGRNGAPATPPPDPPGPAPKAAWTKVSGPGSVTFADATAPVTTAVFSTPGDYVLAVTADNGEAR